MDTYGLYIAYRKWQEKPCFDTFIGLYQFGFDKKCKWSAPRKLIQVCFNLMTGKYQRFYEYQNKQYSKGASENE